MARVILVAYAQQAAFPDGVHFIDLAAITSSAGVEAIFVEHERAYNRRVVQMCSHYLVEPVACTPASGWDKGQV